jgi:DNA-binding MarR family transcriptional regulator
VLRLRAGIPPVACDRLEHGGWVRRRPAADRRYVLVELSPQAIERTPAGLAACHAQIRAIAASIPASHRAAIGSFLQAAADAAAGAAADLRHRPTATGR